MSAKAALLEAIAGCNRGLLADERQKQAIADAVAALEVQSPQPQPLNATEQLNGDWRLLYTTSQELLRFDLIPLYKLGQIYQCIRMAESKIYNIAEVQGLPALGGLVSVAACFTPVSERRVQVKFERAIFGLQRFVGYKNPASFVQAIEAGQSFLAIDFPITREDQQGWLDITYLDDDLRVGRGNAGSLFVLTKR
ncbi:MAG: PAP/fibrillin family protein [Synechococcales bacterium]|nr:PAP/fibrillin family protein [Synechococcales bacterium]